MRPNRILREDGNRLSGSDFRSEIEDHGTAKVNTSAHRDARRGTVRIYIQRDIGPLVQLKVAIDSKRGVDDRERLALHTQRPLDAEIRRSEGHKTGGGQVVTHKVGAAGERRREGNGRRVAHPHTVLADEPNKRLTLTRRSRRGAKETINSTETSGSKKN